MENIINKIVSITNLRRNFGEITANLDRIDYLLIIRDGEPFAILKATPNTKTKILKEAKGAWKNTKLDDNNLWKDVFKRKSRREKITI